MKRILTLVLFTTLFFAGCKKEIITPAGAEVTITNPQEGIVTFANTLLGVHSPAMYLNIGKLTADEYKIFTTREGWAKEKNTLWPVFKKSIPGTKEFFQINYNDAEGFYSYEISRIQIGDPCYSWVWLITQKEKL